MIDSHLKGCLIQKAGTQQFVASYPCVHVQHFVVATLQIVKNNLNFKHVLLPVIACAYCDVILSSPSLIMVIEFIATFYLWHYLSPHTGNLLINFVKHAQFCIFMQILTARTGTRACLT